MRFIKSLSALALILALVSCGEQSPEAPKRGASCVLDAGDYSLRVRRGVAEVEFTAPQGVRGTVVRFGEDGACTIDTTRSLGRGADGASGEYPGVAIPLSDGRGFRDWLVLAYPEDYASGAARADDGTAAFELDGASYTIAPDGKCTVTRAGLTRSAVRTDE